MGSNHFLQRVTLFLKGIAMGAADVVPGVSGGTIAFVTGIYEELVSTIDKLSLSFFKDWKKDGLKTTWKAYNLNFLLVLGAGIAFSILSLAKLVTYAMEVYPIAVWSFFFGLILASVIYIGKQVKRWGLKEILLGHTAAFVAYFITTLKPLAGTDSTYFFFIAGFFGIIAMILPGVSGAFILLLLGAYRPVLETLSKLTEGLRAMDMSIILPAGSKIFVFCLGMLVGIKLFSRVLTMLLKNYKFSTLAILTGFMVGSLNKIWPWREVVSYRTNSKGEQVPFVENNVLPSGFEGDPQVVVAVLFMVLGFMIIFGLEYFASRKTKLVK